MEIETTIKLTRKVMPKSTIVSSMVIKKKPMRGFWGKLSFAYHEFITAN